MILCDAGPLIALIDRTETYNHERCKASLSHIRGPLITTWPCLTEAMYFLGSRGGSPLQELLWRYIELEKLRIHTPTDIEPRRMRELMATYSDLPMDLADASLVTAAEATGLYRIFTIDSHFFAYRINGVIPFETVPT